MDKWVFRQAKAQGHDDRQINATGTPACWVQSARNVEQVRLLCDLTPTLKPCSCTSTGLANTWPAKPTPSFSWTGLMDRAHGSGSWIGLMDRAGWHTTGKPNIPGNIPRNITIPGTSQLSRCHQNRRNRTRSKTYGSTCLPTGSPTGPSKTTTQSSMQRAMHRTISLSNRKPSLQSE